MIDWLNKTLSFGALTSSPLEILGFITGATYVYLNTRQNVWAWFLGIVNAILYAAVFWQVKLYADMGLQGYYFLTSIYGWWMWKYGGQNHDGIRVTYTPLKLYPVFGLIFITTTILWGFLLGHFTDASLSYADSALTIASLIGQWMLARKFLENWVIWIIADACYAAMYLYKSLHLTAILYTVFTVLAILGYVQWKRDIMARERES
jgi:nicotinamide mononucleotide transporter